MYISSLIETCICCRRLLIMYIHVHVRVVDDYQSCMCCRGISIMYMYVLSRSIMYVLFVCSSTLVLLSSTTCLCHSFQAFPVF